ncbi:MAG: VOC family protein [Xanthomonadales bacterium]|nr:VOC family protein [Xanthomonadales bacterium]
MMKIKALGHVVLKVTDLERAEAFYNGVLGLPACARLDQDGFKLTFFSLGNHHDFAIMEVSGGDNGEDENRVGLHHVAFNIGTSLDDLREAKTKLDNAGVSTEPIDHAVTKSLYFEDPDGNGIELYVDVSDSWRKDPQRVAQIMPLEL